MARPLRIEFPGGFYHVTSRGNQRSVIFLADADRLAWLGVLADVADRFRWQIYAYCQMANHFHLLVKTPEPNLARCMRHLNGVYAQTLNRRHDRSGHLLQGRYHAIIVDDQRYLQEVIRYVVLNPVRAGLVRRAGDWPWSSCRATAGMVQAPTWLATGEVLRQFSANAPAAAQAFCRFVAAGDVAGSPWKGLHNEIYLGDATFIARVQVEMREVQRHDIEIPVPQRSLPDIVDTRLTRAKRGSVAAATAYASGDLSMRQIASRLGVHYSTVSRWLARNRLLKCKT